MNSKSLIFEKHLPSTSTSVWMLESFLSFLPALLVFLHRITPSYWCFSTLVSSLFCLVSEWSFTLRQISLSFFLCFVVLLFRFLLLFYSSSTALLLFTREKTNWVESSYFRLHCFNHTTHRNKVAAVSLCVYNVRWIKLNKCKCTVRERRRRKSEWEIRRKRAEKTLPSLASRELRDKMHHLTLKNWNLFDVKGRRHTRIDLNLTTVTLRFPVYKLCVHGSFRMKV